MRALRRLAAMRDWRLWSGRAAVAIVLAAMGSPVHAEDTTCSHAMRCTVEVRLSAGADRVATVLMGRHGRSVVVVPAAFARRTGAALALFTPLADGFAFSVLDGGGLALMRLIPPAQLAGAPASLPSLRLARDMVLVRRDLTSGLLVATPRTLQGALDEPGVYLLRPLLQGEHGTLGLDGTLVWRHIQPSRYPGGIPCSGRLSTPRHTIGRVRTHCVAAPRPTVLLIPPRVAVDLSHSAANARVTVAVLFPDGARAATRGRTRPDGSWHGMLTLDHRPARADLPAILSTVVERDGRVAVHTIALAITP